MAPNREQITGVPQAKASAIVTGKFSYHSLQKISTRAFLIAAIVFSRGE
jgi:hypothetical protein